MALSHTSVKYNKSWAASVCEDGSGFFDLALLLLLSTRRRRNHHKQEHVQHRADDNSKAVAANVIPLNTR